MFCVTSMQVIHSWIHSSLCHNINNLSICPNAVTIWHLANNPSKTEVLITGKRQVIKFETSTSANRTIRFAHCHTMFASSELQVIATCLSMLLSLVSYSRITTIFTGSSIKTLPPLHLHSSRLNYCSALLYGITSTNKNRLQHVHISLVRLVINAPYCSSSLPLRNV